MVFKETHAFSGFLASTDCFPIGNIVESETDNNRADATSVDVSASSRVATSPLINIIRKYSSPGYSNDHSLKGISRFVFIENWFILFFCVGFAWGRTFTKQLSKQKNFRLLADGCVAMELQIWFCFSFLLLYGILKTVECESGDEKKPEKTRRIPHCIAASTLAPWAIRNKKILKLSVQASFKILSIHFCRVPPAR